MAINRVVSIILSVRDKMGPGLKAAARRLNQLAVGANRAGLAMGVGAAILGTGLKKVLGAAISLDDQMLKMQSRMPGASPEDIKKLRDLTMELGKTTTFTTVQVAELMNTLAQGGKSRKEMEGLAKPMLNFARATGISTAQAAEFTQFAMAGFNLGIEDAVHITDVLTAASQSSFQSVEHLGEALNQAAVSANATGASFEGTIANLALMADAGIRGGRAGTGLKNVYTRLAGKGGDVLTDMGIKLKDVAGKMKSLPELMSEFAAETEHLGQLGQLGKFEEAFGKIGLNAAKLLADGGLSINEFRDKLLNVTDVAEDAAALMDSGIGGAIRRLWSAVDVLVISIGNGLIPIIDWLAKSLTVAVNFLSGFADLFYYIGPILVTVFGVLAGGAVSLMALGGMFTLLSTAASVLGGVFVFVVAAVAWIGTAFAFVMSLTVSWPLYLAALGIAILAVFTDWGKLIGDVKRWWKHMTSDFVMEWEGMVAALKKGDFKLFMKILFLSVQISAMSFLDKLWSGWRDTLKEIVEFTMASTVVINNVWSDMVGGMADAMTWMGVKVGIFSKEMGAQMISDMRGNRKAAKDVFARWSNDLSSNLTAGIGEKLEDAKKRLAKLKNEALGIDEEENFWERNARLAKQAYDAMMKAARKFQADLDAWEKENFKMVIVKSEITTGALTGASAASLQSQLAKGQKEIQKDQLTEQVETNVQLRKINKKWVLWSGN